MKVFKKINLGLVLTIIVVAIVAIYSVSVEMQRNKEKDNIKLACEEFIKATNDYITLPENYQNLNEKITDQNFNSYIEEVKKGLKEKMIDNESAINIQATIIEDELTNQIATENIVTKFEKEITKISSYAFDGDQVTVTFKGKVDKDTKYLTTDFDNYGRETKKEETKNSSFDVASETITLQKIDDKWKVVYADVSYSENQAMFGSSFMF